MLLSSYCHVVVVVVKKPVLVLLVVLDSTDGPTTKTFVSEYSVLLRHVALQRYY
jgi:hypothetical protein